MRRLAQGSAILLLALHLDAAAPDTRPRPSGTEEKELAELLSIVAEETDVATKSRMNSDYVPGIVSVLTGDDLEALGVATAGEALGLVPGMTAVRDDRGSPSAIVRGIDFPFNSGNLLILVNSIPLTRQDAGINSSALLMPVEQIERIEVIRGPGSVVYGDYAFMGLVNIVTRKEASRVFARIESPHTALTAGGRAAWKSGLSTISANLARYTASNAPAPEPVSNAGDHRWFAAVNWEREGLSLSAQTARRSYDPPPNAPPFDETSWALDGRYAKPLAPHVTGELRLTYLDNDVSDFISHFQGHLLKGGASATCESFRAQSILVGAEVTKSTTDDAAHRIVRPGQPPGNPISLVHGVDRTITSFIVQDRLEATHNIGVTLGARYDSYSDFQSRLTPRVAVVWRVSDRHIVKAQYSEGFRPPTFFELYQPPAPGSNPRYGFEKNATTEANYVYRSVNQTGRATIFHSVIHQLIRPGGILTEPDARANGAELEWSQQFTPAVKVTGNVSYSHTVDPRAIGPEAPHLPNAVSAPWLANATGLYRLGSSVLLAARWSYLGPRPSAGGFSIIDLTASRENLFVTGLQLRAGVKNAANSDVTYLNLRPNGLIATTRFPGRSIWAQLSWKR